MTSAVAESVIHGLDVAAYRIPLEQPERDATLEWKDTTMVVVSLSSGDHTGYGYTYSNAGIMELIRGPLRHVVMGADCLQARGIWEEMQQAVRNVGHGSMSAAAISAVDTAVWDLAAKTLDCPLYHVLGACHTHVPVYGSGGFTNMPTDEILGQLEEWLSMGINRIKIKIGPDTQKDRERVVELRHHIGQNADCELMVDANGGYAAKQALDMATFLADLDICWFEEPVDAEDFDGHAFLRQHVPPCVEIASGEYGWTLPWFRRLLLAGAVDVVQADITRCGGLTGFMMISDLCRCFQLPLSTHAAPALHLHAAAACPTLRHCEWFSDHADIEQAYLDGAPKIDKGTIKPDIGRPGHGLKPRFADMEPFRI